MTDAPKPKVIGLIETDGRTIFLVSPTGSQTTVLTNLIDQVIFTKKHDGTWIMTTKPNILG